MLHTFAKHMGAELAGRHGSMATEFQAETLTSERIDDIPGLIAAPVEDGIDADPATVEEGLRAAPLRLSFLAPG